MSISKAIEVAVKMEKDAIEFYREALDKTDHPTGVKIFEQFMKVELKHLKMLKDIVKKIDPRAKLIFPTNNVETVFTKNWDKMKDKVDVTTDEFDAIKIALEFEKKGYDFYKKFSEEAESVEEKKLFTILASHEEGHFNFLDKVYKHIKDTGAWSDLEDLEIHLS